MIEQKIRRKFNNYIEAVAKMRHNKDEHKIELLVSGEFVQAFAKFLQTIGNVASQGHSFDIEADRDMAKDYSAKGGHYPKVGFDGDGNDRIISVTLDGKKVKV